MTRSTSFSVRRRYSIRSATVISFRPCRLQYGMRSGTRAIVPSSFMISQMTPAGFRPARRARSTAVSVWPARCSTPPGFAATGNTWPGRTRSPGPFVGSIATWIVCERSAAEIPVVTPSRASIELSKVGPVGCLVVVLHRRQAKLVAALLREQQADEAPRRASP